ncbi:MAG: glycosyltransferase family 9 protein, partial [Nitrospirae bacterium]|nr:glycosyltransferase family 9 protein [Nitrospirota bacterium]
PVAYDPERYEAENFLALLSALTAAPIPFNPEQPFLTIPADPSPGLRVIMAPGASYPEKQWGPEKFRRLAAGFLEQGYSVGLIGGPADARQAAEVIQGLPVENFTGRTTLRETARVIGAAGLVIGGDSVALHLAAALGRPSIALFGPTPPQQWAPRGKNRRTLYHPPHCSPCSRFGHIPPCPYDVECLKHISVEEVQEAARQIMMTEAPGK